MVEKIDAQITTLKNQFGSDFDEAISYYYGVNTQKELYDYIEMTYKREIATNEYAQTLIDDEDIQKYYDEKAIGDIKASHILIKSEATDDMTDEQKAAAETKALNTAKDIIKKLNDGEKFADLAKKYSGDSSASDGGNLGYFNRGDMVTEFEDAAVALKVNEYTKTPVKTKYGYHIILKTDQKSKPKLSDIKSDIRTTLIDSLIANTANITTYAMEWIREKYDLKIYDSELKIKYDHYMNEQKLKEPTTSTNS
jgi:foldase protein PrsA